MQKILSKREASNGSFFFFIAFPEDRLNALNCSRESRNKKDWNIALYKIY